MSAEPPVRYMTVEEYLEFEESSTEKHEFIGGVIYAMAGADFPHNQIFSNSLIAIGSYLRDKSCRVYGSDLKVAVKTKSEFAYPDLTIVCGGAQFFSGKRGIVTNPSVIIEILSAETKNYDYGEKFMLYRQIETLTEYILISSLELRVEKFQKEAAGTWTMTEYKSLTDALPINTIQFNLPLEEIYRDVVFEEKDYSRGIVRPSAH